MKPGLLAGGESDDDMMEMAGEPKSRLVRGDGLRLPRGLRLTSSTSTSLPPSSVSMAAALSRTLGTLSSVFFARGMR